MRRVGKAWVFIFVLLIGFFSYSTFFGISSQYGDNRTVYIKGAANEDMEGDGIRWGVDIRGGVNVTFRSEEVEVGTGVYKEITKAELDSAVNTIKNRLTFQGVTDYEVYGDEVNGRIFVRYPWKTGDDTKDVAAAIEELGATAVLTFRKGNNDTEGEDLFTGEHVTDAQAAYNTTNGNYVALELDSEAATVFSSATAVTGEYISIFLDDKCVSAATVQSQITDGKAIISGGFDAAGATQLAATIKSGSMPVKLVADTYGSINPTLGNEAKNVMVLAGAIGMLLVVLYMLFFYRLPGAVASICVIAQTVASIAFITGYFGGSTGFTLTLPGIAGIILSIGMGVDANVVTNERIKEELRAGRTIDGAIDAGNKGSFWAIFDGNITSIIVAIILMGVFGPPDSLASKLLSPVLFMFGPATAGSVYSFGYTLFVGILMNFIFGVFISRLMLKSTARFKFLRKPWLYGGASK